MTYPHDDYNDYANGPMADDDLALDYDMSQVDENEGPNFEDLAPGKYRVMATNVEVRATKDGNGKYINVTFDVVDGPRSGSKLFVMYNVINKSDQAVKIALKALKSWRAACKLNPNDSFTLNTYVRPLEGIEFIALVGFGKATGNYPAKPEIKAYFSDDGTFNAAAPNEQRRPPVTTPQQASREPAQQSAPPIRIPNHNPPERQTQPPRQPQTGGKKPWEA